MTRIGDARARELALDPTHSFIVQAPAGSGKTELLTQRFLRLLTGVEEPEQILAITFTRKAAGEMRERILAALHKARDDRPEAEWAQRTWELTRAVLKRDTERGWQLTDNPNRLRVLTFDSLAASLARQMPVLSRLGSAPHACEDARPLYREATRQLLTRLGDEDIGPALKTVLRHLHNRLGRLEELLVDMLNKRDQWLPHLDADPEHMAQVLRDQIEYHIALSTQRIPSDRLDALIRLAHIAAPRVPEDRLAWLPRWAERDTPPGTAWEDLPYWLGLVELALNKNTPVFRTRLTKNEGFPPKNPAKDEMTALLQTLATKPGLANALHSLRTLPLAPPDAEQRQLLNALTQVLQQAAAELLLVFQTSGKLDFVEIQQRALRALGTPDAPGEAALRLDYRLLHLLVDEFQDTSSGQYQLLTRLTAGWEPDDGRTLFLVGDPMQSIYRFRKAEVSLFLQAFEGRLGEVALTPLTLARNFRSQAVLVDWFNSTFRQIFPMARDIALGAMPHTPSEAVHPALPGEAVTVHPLNTSDASVEAERVVGIVRQRLTESPGSVAILARARAHLAEIARALGEAGIPYQAVKVAPLADQPTVRDLHALLRSLLHPADRLHWLALLRSPLVGLSLDDIVHLAEGEPRHLYTLLADPQARARLSADGRQRADRLHALLEQELPARHRRPLREWLEGFWLALGGAVVGRREDAETYLALVEQHAAPHGIEDLSLLENVLAELYAPPDTRPEAEQVLLTTLHQSKGLQFDTVILPGLGRKARNEESRLLYWHELPHPEGGTELLIAPIPRRTGTDPLVDYLKTIERQKAEHEQQRLLYVAATRTKSQLHLLGHVKFSRSKHKADEPYPENSSLLATLWPAVEQHFAELTPPEESTDEGTPTPPVSEQRIATDWRLSAPSGITTSPFASAGEEPGIGFLWAGDTARHVGTLVHRWLERIAHEKPAHWPVSRIDELPPRFRIALATLGVAPEALDEAADKVTHALRQTLEDERGRWLLDAHEQAACEWSLTVLDEQGKPRQYVIDRTFITDGVRWIIDYKTGDHQGGDLDNFLDSEQERYRAQLENYGRILRLREDRPVRLALYFPLLGGWREWAP